MDGDFAEEKLKDVYNGDLANGLGNLVSRVAKLAETNNIDVGSSKVKDLDKKVADPLNDFRFDFAVEEIWKKIKSLDTKINKEEIWKDTNRKTSSFVEIVEGIRQIGYNLKPFLPETAEKIEKQFSESKIKSSEPLFPRIK